MTQLTGSDSDVNQALLAQDRPKTDFSIAQIPNYVYYNAYLRYALACTFVVGKIIQAAGQNIIGVTKSLAMVPGINPWSVTVITALLTLINVGVNLSTRAHSIFKGLALNQIYLVENLNTDFIDKVPKGSYVVVSSEPGALYKKNNDTEMLSLGLSKVGESTFFAFREKLDTYFREKTYPDSQSPYLITYELASHIPDALALFSQTLNNQSQENAYESNSAWSTFVFCYSICCVSTVFAALNAYLSGVTLVDNFFPETPEKEQIPVGFFVLICSTMSYLFFNLAKMYTNVSVFCDGIDAGLSSNFDLILVADQSEIPKDAARGKVYISDLSAVENAQKSFAYLTYGMKEWGNISQEQLKNCGNAVDSWRMENFNTLTVKEQIARIIVADGHSPYQGYGINMTAMWLTLAASLFGIIAGCGMAYLMMINGEEKIPLLKDAPPSWKNFLALFNVGVSIFPSFFNFAFSAYDLFAKRNPEKQWVIPQDGTNSDKVNSNKSALSVKTEAVSWVISKGHTMAGFILTDAISNSFGGLMGMLLLVDNYLAPRTLAQVVFADILVTLSFIDNVIMSFTFALTGSKDVIDSLNKLSIRSKVEALSAMLNKIGSSSVAADYQSVTDADLEAPRAPPAAIVFNLGERLGADLRAGRNSNVDETNSTNGLKDILLTPTTYHITFESYNKLLSSQGQPILDANTNQTHFIGNNGIKYLNKKHINTEDFGPA